jgi:hypothetical protein
MTTPGVDQLVTALVSATTRPDRPPFDVGVISKVFVGGYFAVRVTGILLDTIEIDESGCSQPFLDWLRTAGLGAVGRRVLVLFPNHQPVIAFALGAPSAAAQ